MKTVNVDDVIETSNHFRCIDMVIDQAGSALTEKLIKELHFVLKTGTSDSRKNWFAVGEYKKLPNEVGGNDTTLPENVSEEMKKLLADYNSKENVTLEDIIEFHVQFERIHPFQDGNGRVGRLIMFKECLKHGIVPFIIEDKIKMFYYRGLKEWNQEKGYLIDTCLSAQDTFKNYLSSNTRYSALESPQTRAVFSLYIMLGLSIRLFGLNREFSLSMSGGIMYPRFLKLYISSDS